MYFEQVPEYRDTIMESICKCDAIIDLIRPTEAPEMSAKEMAYKYISLMISLWGRHLKLELIFALMLSPQELSIAHSQISISKFGLLPMKGL